MFCFITLSQHIPCFYSMIRGNEEFHYNEAFATLIKSHKGLLKKRGENNGYNAFVI